MKCTMHVANTMHEQNLVTKGIQRHREEKVSRVGCLRPLFACYVLHTAKHFGMCAMTTCIICCSLKRKYGQNRRAIFDKLVGPART